MCFIVDEELVSPKLQTAHLDEQVIKLGTCIVAIWKNGN